MRTAQKDRHPIHLPRMEKLTLSDDREWGNGLRKSGLGVIIGGDRGIIITNDGRRSDHEGIHSLQNYEIIKKLLSCRVDVGWRYISATKQQMLITFLVFNQIWLWMKIHNFLIQIFMTHLSESVGVSSMKLGWRVEVWGRTAGKNNWRSLAEPNSPGLGKL